MLRLLYVLLAAGAALTASSTETVLASKELPANSLQAGKRYKISGVAIATATNSTDTLTGKVRIGPTPLTGTVVATAAATDVANNDVIVFELTATVRSVDESARTAVVVVHGWCSVPGAEGAATMRVAYKSVSVANIDAALKIELTGTWSSTNAGNSCQAEAFTIDEIA